MIIEQTIRVPRGIAPIKASYPFLGDENKTWFLKVENTNVCDGENAPIVDFVRNGNIHVTFPTNRAQGMLLTALFYESGSANAVEEHVTVSRIASILPRWGIGLLGKIAFYSKKLAVTVLILMILSVIFAVANHIFDISGFLDEYQKYNAANGARVLEKTVKNIAKHLDDPFYESEGIKAIEKDLGVSYKSMFTSVDEDLYIMKNVFVDKDGNVILMTYGDAYDRCKELGGYVLPLEIQQEILPKKTQLTVRQWSDTPEWTGTARGLFSDDYVINIKNGGLVEGSYNKNGVIYGDAEDVKIAARCGVLRATFIEED